MELCAAYSPNCAEQRCSPYSRPRFCCLGSDVCGHTRDVKLIQQSYIPLQENSIFEFIELTSAAVNASSYPTPPAIGSVYFETMRRRMQSQLKDVGNSGYKHVILSAFGCGAFLNRDWSDMGTIRTIKQVALDCT